MRIGIVTFSYLPRLGGAVTQTLLWHEYLRRRGHTVEVFCPDLKKDGRFQEGDITVNRVHHRWFRRFEDNRSRLVAIWQLSRAVQRRRTDFDVFVSPEFNVGPLSLCLTRGTRTIGTYGADLTFEYVNLPRETIVPYEAVRHRDLRVLGLKDCSVVAALNLLQRFMFRRLDCVVALNQHDLGRIRPLARRTAVVGCMVAPVPQASEIRQKPRPEPVMATIIGRAVSWKQIGESIELALRLKQAFPKLEIHYCGSGPQLPQLEQAYGRIVTIHAGLRSHEVLEWLARSDMTVNMSDYETFCLVNAEAMLCRSLLLVKPLPVYEDYLWDGRNCVMLGAGGMASTVQRVRSLLGTPALATLLDAAEQTVRDQYSAAVVGPQLEALLASVAGTVLETPP